MVEHCQQCVTRWCDHSLILHCSSMSPRTHSSVTANLWRPSEAEAAAIFHRGRRQ